MNEQELISQGEDAEALLKSEPFNRVINKLVEQQFQRSLTQRLSNRKNAQLLITTIAHSLTW